MSSQNPESPTSQPDLITEIPKQIRESIGETATTGPTFEFPDTYRIPGQVYVTHVRADGTVEDDWVISVRVAGENGTIHKLEIQKEVPEGTLVRKLRGADLEKFLANNPHISRRV